MNSKKINYILKISSQYEIQAHQLHKTAYVNFVIQGLAILAPLVGSIINDVNKNAVIIDSLKKLTSSLDDYKSSYGFGKHEQLLNSYNESAKKLLNSYNKISSIKGNPDPSFVNDLKSFVDNGNIIVGKSTDVVKAMEDMKSWAGSAFDVLKMTGFNLGMNTNTTNIIDQAKNLSASLASEIPSIQVKYDELMSSINNMATKQVEDKPEAEADVASDKPVTAPPTRRRRVVTPESDDNTQGQASAPARAGGGELEGLADLTL